MRKHFNWDRVVATASWVIVAILIYGVFFFMFHALNPNSFIVEALGMTVTRVVFITLYTIQGGLLGYAKWKKRNRLRRHVLLSIYLTGFFLSILGFALNGWTIRLVTNILMSTAAAVCWLYWKFRTEYIGSNQLYLEALEDIEYSKKSRTLDTP